MLRDELGYLGLIIEFCVAILPLALLVTLLVCPLSRLFSWFWTRKDSPR